MKTPMQQPNDKRFVVMHEDGSYYGSFSPLGVWETYEGAEKAEKNWKEANPSKKTSIEEVAYNACQTERPMKTQHTPGPWVYGPEFSAVMTRDKQGTVAILLPLGHTRDDEDIDTEMMDAHGRLMAAAPEMLDALKALMHAYSSHEFPALMDARERAKELIAKLTAE